MQTQNARNERNHAEKFTVKFLYTVDQLDRFYRELKRRRSWERIKISTKKKQTKEKIIISHKQMNNLNVNVNESTDKFMSIQICKII